MKLEQYLGEKGETQASFSQRAVIHQSAVSRIINGGDVRGQVWAAITRATGGAVRPEDHFPKKAKKGRGRSVAKSARAAKLLSTDAPTAGAA